MDARADIDPALLLTLAATGGALANAREPWWVIGSAAMILHGAETVAADVDLLLGAGDARALAAAWGLVPEAGCSPDRRFRSDLFARCNAFAYPVEIMAGFQVRLGARWTPVRPAARMPVVVDAVTLYVPSLDDLIDMCAAFGRPKDARRAALLRMLPR